MFSAVNRHVWPGESVRLRFPFFPSRIAAILMRARSPSSRASVTKSRSGMIAIAIPTGNTSEVTFGFGGGDFFLTGS